MIPSLKTAQHRMEKQTLVFIWMEKQTNRQHIVFWMPSKICCVKQEEAIDIKFLSDRAGSVPDVVIGLSHYGNLVI